MNLDSPIADLCAAAAATLIFVLLRRSVLSWLDRRVIDDEVGPWDEPRRPKR